MLLYGGEPGGGKTDLILGLAFTKHRRSLVMRRQYTDLGFIIERVLELNGGKKGFNGSPPPKLKTSDGRVIDMGAAAKIGDEKHWMGQPHDFIGIDETTQFAEIQVRFLMGWLRSTDSGQRKRAVFATNPPLEAEGLWVTEMFAPWLDEKFINPAKPGELRWAVVDDDDNVIWVEGPTPVVIGDKEREPKSYTYIPSSVSDNPYLDSTGYEKELDALPSETRAILMGGFKTSFKDAPTQIIPTEWVRLAQQRWRPFKPENVPMCTMAVDPTGGWSDPLVIARRYDGWFDELIEVPAKEIPQDAIGSTTVAHIVPNRRNEALVVIDIGGGYGSSAFEILKDNGIDVQGYKGAEKTTRRSGDGKLNFTNTRSAALWMFREALDPGQPGGSPIALPPSNKLLADLTAPTFKVTPNGIKAESKEDVCDRLQRSTNDGDAVIMAWFYGPRETTHALEWLDQRHSKRGQQPKVIMGRQHRRR